METTKKGMGMTLANAGIQAGTSIIGNILGMLGQKKQDERQIKQQAKLNRLSIESNKEMSEFERQQQMKMWEDTNYSAQVDQLKKAGLNAGLLYGMGGTGGATTGGGSGMSINSGTAGDPNAGQANQMGMAMMGAQIENLKANTAKQKAEAEKTAGVDTASGQEDIKAKQFANQLAERTLEDRATQTASEAEIKELEATKGWAEYRAWEQAAFEGKPWDDKGTPIAKALSAGFKKAEVELKQAKAQNNLTEAQTIVERFKANLAEEGISPDSPWYVKMVTDLLSTIGATPKQIGGYK